MADQGFSDRLRLAVRLAALREGPDIEQEELGRRVALLLQRKPYGQGTVSKWFRGSVPPLPVIRALADVLIVSPGWLAFGEDHDAPAIRAARAAAAFQRGDAPPSPD